MKFQRAVNTIINKMEKTCAFVLSKGSRKGEKCGLLGDVVCERHLYHLQKRAPWLCRGLVSDEDMIRMCNDPSYVPEYPMRGGEFRH